MPQQNALVHALNRGLVSPRAINRVDVPNILLAARTMDNWIPKTLGPMTARPGLGYIGGIDGNNAGNLMPFIAGVTDTALFEFTASKLKIWVDDVVVTRPSVSTTISNSTFSSSSGWTDASTGAAQLAFGANGLQMQVDAAGSIAKLTRQVTVSGGDQNTEHGIKIVIPTGYDYVYLRIGSSAGTDDYIEETRLLAGQHHLGFTPTGDFHITMWATDRYSVEKRVTSFAIETNTDVEIATPWTADDLSNLQGYQSADVVFVACDTIKQKRIERRSARSWSVVDYRSFDGPFLGQTVPLRLEPSATYGRPNLVASQDFFRSTHVGALFRVFHSGQNFTMVIGGEEQWSDPIRIAGVQGENFNEREFTITTANIGSSTVNIQRSVIGPDQGFGNYPRDAGAATTEDITTSTSYTNEDEDDNLIVWYRLGIGDGNYNSGDAVSVSFAYPYGGDFGLCRVVAYTNATTVAVEVLKAFRGTGPTDNWSEGAWSDVQGYPTATAIFEGRLWWFSGISIWGSVSDDYESYDQENVNFDGPIIRTIGEGAVDAIHFALTLGDLVIGSAGGEYVLRSSVVGEPMTPTSFSVKPISTYGSKKGLPAVKIDEIGFFVHRSGQRLYRLRPASTKTGYATDDITIANPELLVEGVVSIAVQRMPDTRIYCVLADGTCAILTFDEAENLQSWSTISTGTSGAPGAFERVAVLSREDEDAVYFIVKRTINGSVVRYLEKMALETECEGGTVCKLMDSHVAYNGSATTTMTGLSHLEGEDVVAWTNGVAEETSPGVPKTFTVSSGQITGLTSGTDHVAGLAYDYDWESTKLAYAAAGGTALSMLKRALKIGPLLHNTHHDGLKFGRDFDNLFPLPEIIDGQSQAGTIWSEFDKPVFPFGGEWDTDAHVYCRGQSPYPATVSALVIEVQTSG